MVTAEPSSLAEVAERLRRLVEDAGGRKAVSEAADVPISSLDRYLAAKSEAPSLTLGRIARACGTSVDAILYGANGRTLVMIEAKRVPAAEPINEAAFVRVPFLEVRASAGAGRASLPAETVAAEQFLFSRAWLRSLGVVADRAELLQAQGDSMYPTIHDGDLMLIDRGYGEVVHGKIYALVVNGLVIVKRVHYLAGGGMILLSDNDRYPSETIRRDEVGQLSFQGRVAWYGRAI